MADNSVTDWHKSSYSLPNGDCLEAAQVPEGMAIRDSKDTLGPLLLFGRDDWQEFVSIVKTSESG